MTQQEKEQITKGNVPLKFDAVYALNNTNGTER